MKSNFRYLDRDQFIENVIGHAIQANKLTWTTLRYSVANVDFLFKPILTKMNLEQSTEGLEFTFDKEVITGHNAEMKLGKIKSVDKMSVMNGTTKPIPRASTNEPINVIESKIKP